MPLQFYHVPYTTATVTACVLDELEHGLPERLAERIELSISAGDTKKPSYLAINPNGLVPAIVHDGVPIWESAVITMYLGETFGVASSSRQEALYPDLGPKRGETMKWILWANAHLAEHAGRLRSGPELGEEAAKQVEAEAREKLTKGMRILDQELGRKEFIIGEKYCLADTHLWSFVMYMTMCGIDLEEYPKVKDWAARVGARPALKRN
ncbi:glutathione S-transferase [Myriangium duriaei CBS 260.36]|uniref:Glutathione S-transferase n=1 Tax=Myriangium duriaei CBS 260.36 TaxID=1168546 RepID=A0A9P4IUI7_9PEZI|nr:glutathione S-transferase [Myriangium duriaei CBS 260.36]